MVAVIHTVIGFLLSPPTRDEKGLSQSTENALLLAGAVGVTVVMTLSGRVRAGGDSRPVTLHMLATAISIFTLVALVHGGVRLPHTSLGVHSVGPADPGRDARRVGHHPGRDLAARAYGGQPSRRCGGRTDRLVTCLGR